MLRVFFIVVVALPILLICLIILNVYRKDLLEQNTGRSLQTTEAVSYSVGQEINRMVGMLASIGMDQEVLDTASSIQRTTGLERQAAVNKLTVMIDKYTSAVAGKVLSVNFFYKEGGSYSYLHNMMEDELQSRRQKWYNETIGIPDRVRFLGMRPNMLYGNDNPNMMAAALSPSDYHILHNVDLIFLTFKQSVFDNILQSKDVRDSILSVISETGDVIVTNSMADQTQAIPNRWIQTFDGQSSGSFLDDSDGNAMLITYDKVEDTGWWVVQRFSYHDLMANYRQVYNFIWVTAVMITVAFVIVSFYFVSNVTRPIRQLLRHILKVTEGDLEARIKVSGSMELIKLGQSFNLMTERIHALIQQRRRNAKRSLPLFNPRSIRIFSSIR